MFRVAKSIGKLNEINDGREGVVVEDMLRSHVVVVEGVASENSSCWALS